MKQINATDKIFKTMLRLFFQILLPRLTADESIVIAFDCKLNNDTYTYVHVKWSYIYFFFLYFVEDEEEEEREKQRQRQKVYRYYNTKQPNKKMRIAWLAHLNE